jgi:hypothetical protein
MAPQLAHTTGVPVRLQVVDAMGARDRRPCMFEPYIVLYIYSHAHVYEAK